MFLGALVYRFKALVQGKERGVGGRNKQDRDQKLTQNPKLKFFLYRTNSPPIFLKLIVLVSWYLVSLVLVFCFWSLVFVPVLVFGLGLGFGVGLGVGLGGLCPLSRCWSWPFSSSWYLYCQNLGASNRTPVQTRQDTIDVDRC